MQPNGEPVSKDVQVYWVKTVKFSQLRYAGGQSFELRGLFRQVDAQAFRQSDRKSACRRTCTMILFFSGGLEPNYWIVVIVTSRRCKSIKEFLPPSLLYEDSIDKKLCSYGGRSWC